MYKSDEIDWTKLRTELTEYIHIPQETKLPSGIFVCSCCDGSGRVVTVHRTFPPHKYGKCYICNGTGKIKKCIVPDCKRALSSNDLGKLCIGHEEERRDKMIKELLDKEQSAYPEK